MTPYKAEESGGLCFSLVSVGPGPWSEGGLGAQLASKAGSGKQS